MTGTDNARFLAQAAAARHQATLSRASNAIERLNGSGQPVNFSAVAAAADFSELRMRGEAWRLVPSAGVPDGVEDEVDVGLVESGDDVPQGDG